MDILYHFRTQGTGAEGVHISGVANAFEQLGHTVTFSSPTGNDPRETAGMDPFKGGKGAGVWSLLARCSPRFLFEILEIFYNLVSFMRNSKLLKAKKVDLIYERHAFFLCATARLAETSGIPLVVEVNELVGDERIRKQPVLSGLAKKMDCYTLKRAARIVVVSPHLKRRIADMGVDPDRIIVLPNAVEYDAVREEADGTQIRAEFGIPPTAIVVGFVGWLVKWHLLDQLLRIFADLAADFPDLRLILVGDGPLRHDLEYLAPSLGVMDRLTITGAIPHTRVPAHIAAMDVGVIPHSNEYRSPIKLFECMAQGIAVVAPGTEPINMVVRDEVNGILFEAGDADAMASALRRAVKDAQLRRRIGTQARADVLQKHTWRQNAEAVLGGLPAAR